MPLAVPGEAYLADPSPAPLAGVQGLFLVYPYGGFGALSRTKPWVRFPRTLGVIALHDHVTAAGDAEPASTTSPPSGGRRSSSKIWRVEGTHAFDEEHASVGTSCAGWRSRLTEQAHAKFQGFLAKTLGPAEVAQAKSA